jgi:hypothetical protein
MSQVHLGQSVKAGFFDDGSSVWELNDEGQFVLRRSSLLGVVYEPPPVPEGWLTWTKVRGKPNVFELRFGQLPSFVFSFADYCAFLRSGATPWQKIPCGSPEIPEPLRKLDLITEKILALAEHLHRRGWGLGLIDPQNILIFELPGGPAVVFSDLGFSWGSAPPLIEPEFMRSLKEGNVHAKLWDGGNARLQLLRGRADPAVRADPVPDIRALARVFVSALLGEYHSEVPDAETCALTRAQPPFVECGRRVWITLTRAVKGEYSSWSEFRQALEATPLSQHFLGESPAPLRRRSWMGVAVGLALIAGVAAGVWFFWPKLNLPNVKPFTLNEPSGRPSADVCRELKAIAQEVNEFVKQVMSLYADYQKDPIGTYFSSRKKSGDFLRTYEALSQKLAGLRNSTVASDPSCAEKLAALQADLEQARIFISELR